MNRCHAATIKLMLFHVIIIINLSCGSNTQEKGTTTHKLSDNSSMERETKGQGFIETFHAAGIFDACKEMGIDFDAVFAPIAVKENQYYWRYRWSVSRDEHGNPVIHALPPEEEMGWTPWERWSIENNMPIRTDWILYPVRQPIDRSIINWYELEESNNLVPRFLQEANDLATKLRLARVDVAAKWLGIDFQEIFIDPLQPVAQKIYAKYRWVVIPHVLAQDGPVIYALPPMSKTDDWPWESWYTDGRISQIHHIHYTQEKAYTSGSWAEGPGAPQRPPEIFGLIWYWYNDPEMIPVLMRQKKKKLKQ